MGKPLLNRSSKGVSPTENGLALYHHAQFMLRQLDQALSIACSEAGAIQGMVSVGLPATTVSAIGLQLVRRIRERYPSVLLNVVEGMSGHIGHLMRLGQLDLAVLFSNDIAPDARRAAARRRAFRHAARAQHAGPAPAQDHQHRQAAAIPLILPTASHGLRQRITANSKIADFRQKWWRRSTRSRC